MRGRCLTFALALTTAAIVSTAVSAHRRDENLQAVRLSVEPDRVDIELDVTPGIEVAEATIADLDRDRDGVFSEEERRTYAARVLGAVAFELDGRSLHAQPTASTFPALDDFRRGEGTIQLRAVVALPPQSGGDHQLSFRHANQPGGNVYLANALVPKSDRVTIAAQRRDPAQRELTIDYVLRTGPATSAPAWLFGGLAGLAVLAVVRRRPSLNRLARFSSPWRTASAVRTHR